MGGIYSLGQFQAHPFLTSFQHSLHNLQHQTNLAFDTSNFILPFHTLFFFVAQRNMVSTAEGIAIAELCVYIPIFILTVVVMIRHGFQRQLGWIYLAIFCIIRLAGAGFKIESVHHPTNKTDIEWSAILQSVGLSPLLMASMGLLKRV